MSIVNHEKRFSTLRASLALAGYTLLRSNPADGSVSYFIRWEDFLLDLPNPEAVEHFTAKSDGRWASSGLNKSTLNTGLNSPRGHAASLTPLVAASFPEKLT